MQKYAKKPILSNNRLKKNAAIKEKETEKTFGKQITGNSQLFSYLCLRIRDEEYLL